MTGTAYYYWDAWRLEAATWGTQKDEWRFVDARGPEPQSVEGANWVSDWMGNYYLTSALSVRRKILVRRWRWDGARWTYEGQKVFQ